jgi:hypothetical protein
MFCVWSSDIVTAEFAGARERANRLPAMAAVLALASFARSDRLILASSFSRRQTRGIFLSL